MFRVTCDVRNSCVNRFAFELDIGGRRTDVFNPPWVKDQNKPRN